jgi:MFS transporter, ACS family, hexuronate transporter
MLEKNNYKMGGYRWRMVALLFFATSVNYVDRNVISFIATNPDFICDMIGKPHLLAGQAMPEEYNKIFKELYGQVQSLFKLAYGLGFLLMGWFIDKVGVRLGYSVSIFIWGMSALAHSLIGSITGLKIVRFTLGIGEAGNFPSAIKTVSEWFPKKERSTATGLFNAGANVGIMFTALSVPFLMKVLPWNYVFICTSTLAALLFIAWRLIYQKPEDVKQLSTEEMTYIRQDGEDLSTAKVTWGKLFPFPQTWAFIVGKFMTDCIWWFYMAWLPKFFAENGNFKIELNLAKIDLVSGLMIALPFIIIYTISDLGSILFGRVSSLFLEKGWTANAARKTTMLICGLCVVPVFFTAITSNVVIAVALISLAAAAHQGWSANLFTTVTDMFPRRAVSSVTGIGGMFGALGGALLDFNSGTIINTFGYIGMFIIASSAYVTALLIIHLLAPKLEPVKI